jgi:hypothetical protein
MATQYDPATGTFSDDGVNDQPADYTEPLKAPLNGDTQPPPLDTGYTVPLQKALAATQAPQNPQSPGGQDGLALPAIDVDKIADQIGHVGAPSPAALPALSAPPSPPVTSPPLPAAAPPAAITARPSVNYAPLPGAPATAVRHTVLSPESQQAITQLDTATGNEAAAQRQLGDIKAQKADATAEGARQMAAMQTQRQQRIQDRVAKAQADYDARVKEYDQQYTKLKGMKETDFYADKSTSYKIGAAISIALGAISQAFGGKNVGAELIGKEIEAHAARQRNEIVNQREIVEKAHVGVEGAKNEADRQSLLWETAAFDRASADVQARAAQFGGPEEKAKAAAIASQLDAKSAEKKALLLKMTGEQVVTDTGRQTEADRLAAIAAKAKAKPKGAAGGGAGSGGEALREIMAGADPADVQKKYHLSDKALKTVLGNAKEAPNASAGEDNPRAVRVNGQVRGLAPSTRNVKQMEDRFVNYDDAVTSLKELLRSGDRIPIGSPAYNRAVLAIATVTTANASDKTTEHEASTIKQYGLLSKDAIQQTLDHVQARYKAFEGQLQPVRRPPASGAASYVDAARAAKAQLSGGTPPPGAPDPRIDLARRAVNSPAATPAQKKNAQAFLDAHGG